MCCSRSFPFTWILFIISRWYPVATLLICHGGSNGCWNNCYFHFRHLHFRTFERFSEPDLRDFFYTHAKWKNDKLRFRGFLYAEELASKILWFCCLNSGFSFAKIEKLAVGWRKPYLQKQWSCVWSFLKYFTPCHVPVGKVNANQRNVCLFSLVWKTFLFFAKE